MENEFRHKRLAVGYYQLKLSVLAGISPATIVAIEKYDYMPGPWVRSKLAKALAVPETILWPRLKNRKEKQKCSMRNRNH